MDRAGRTDSIAETADLMLRDATREDTQNLVVQLCGSCPERLSRATTAVMEIYNKYHRALPFGIDLNLGCPQECAQRHGFGAFLAEDNPSTAVSCVASMREAIDGFQTTSDRPLLSAKIRLLEGGAAETIGFVRKLKAAGANYVAIHCRHRTDKHTGNADWEAGGKIVDAFSSELPIVLNGGISTYEDAAHVLERTGCHAVMSATGYLQNHRRFQASHDATTFGPQHAALEYLQYAEEYPPPSYLYIQKHLRWIFRETLQPGETDPSFDQFDYSDWRVKLWSFLVRPYLRTIEQFRMFVALYVQLSGDGKDAPPQSIRHLIDEVSFGSVKKAGKRKRAS